MSAKMALVSSWRGSTRLKSLIFATLVAGKIRNEPRGDPNLEESG
jgi:hypothetical protein